MAAMIDGARVHDRERLHDPRCAVITPRRSILVEGKRSNIGKR